MAIGCLYANGGLALGDLLQLSVEDTSLRELDGVSTNVAGRRVCRRLGILRQLTLDFRCLGQLMFQIEVGEPHKAYTYSNG